MSLEIQGVGYHYPGGFVLEPVTLSIPAGKFVVLPGPNGSGKSTLFSLIGGRLKPTKGNITLGGTLSPPSLPRRGPGVSVWCPR